MPLKKRDTPFQKGHEVACGLWVTEADPRKKFACNVVCQFCEMFGQKEQPRRKTKATENAQFYTEPFRLGRYHKQNHTLRSFKWSEYQSLVNDNKSAFFDAVVQIKRTLPSHYWMEITPRFFKNDVAIVHMFIGSMHFDIKNDCDSEEEPKEVEAARCTDGRRYPDLTPLKV